LSATPIFHKLEILKINELCQYEIGKLMFKHSTRALPSSFSSLFTDTVSQQSTKDKLDLRLTTTFMYQNFLQIVIKGRSTFRVQKYGIQFLQNWNP